MGYINIVFFWKIWKINNKFIFNIYGKINEKKKMGIYKVLIKYIMNV